ncbi:MAG: cytochrome c biogenesis protein CcdA, partial [Chloroflexota bacterium]
FISFISPCVLPLVPAYISYMGGRVTNTVAAQAAGGGTVSQAGIVTRLSTGIHSLFFVVGFSAVFVGIGLLTTSFVQVVGGSNVNTATALIGRVGGVVIIVFGLHFMGALSSIFNFLRQEPEQMLQRYGQLKLHFTVAAGLSYVLFLWLRATHTLIPFNLGNFVFGMAGFLMVVAVAAWFGYLFIALYTWVRRGESDGSESFFTAFTIVFFAYVTAIIFWALDIPPSPFAEDANIFNRVLLSLPVFVAFAMWFAMSGAFGGPKQFWLKFFTQMELALYADTRKQMAASGNTGYGGTAVMGVVFAAGWTPCIGPIYGAILTLAANGGSVSQAGTMLLAYSLGLGIPFIATALLLDSAQGILRNLNQHMGTIKMASGAFLIFIGGAVATGQLQSLSATGANGEFAYNIEECFTGAVAGTVAWGDIGSCVNGEDDAEDEGTTALTGNGAQAEIGGITEDTAGIGGITDDAAGAEIEGEAAAETTELTVGLNVGELAPNFETFTADGEPIALEDLRGQTVLLNFWATWCGPCRIEMPEFQDAYEANREDGFVILAVNNREN